MGGVYQNKLDEALLAQEGAADDDKVDMFLAEADYILKYTDSDYTMDVTAIGVTDFSQMYPYTVQAASDANGVVKGVSFQCCPSAMIYRRSIAKDVLGTDDPVQVQAALDSWEKFDAVAAQAKAKGYLMTPAYVETYRTFSNNCSMPWVDENNNLQFDPMIDTWLAQAKDYLDKGYTLSAGIWDAEKNDHMFKTGKAMCLFGPAWYYNFCMGNALDPVNGTIGDWAICKGPQAHFWGGTWMLAATGTDNPTMVADIMKLFTVNEDVCSRLISEQQQFSNNQKVNAAAAADPNTKNIFLGDQNDTAIFVELSKDIKFENKTIYDQLLNEKFQEYMKDYCLGNADKDTCLSNFYKYVNETYPDIVTP